MTTPTLDLPALKALNEKATPAPWTNGIPARNDSHMCQINAWPDGEPQGHRIGVGIGVTWHPDIVVSYVGLSRQTCVDNANLIAAMRNALPALLAEVERLREALRDFGRHRPSCGLNRRFDAAGNVIGFGTECDCGLLAALAEPRKGE